MAEAAQEGAFPRTPGLIDKAAQLISECRSWMAHWSGETERGPEDYDRDNKRDLESLLASAAREGARRATVDLSSSGGGHGRQSGGGEADWQKWAMTIVGLLVVAGICRSVTDSSEIKSRLATVEANQNNQKNEMSELKVQVIEVREHVRSTPITPQ